MFHGGGSFHEFEFLFDGINRVNNWHNTHHKPIFLGEFGVSQHADADSRCRWVQLMGANLDSTHIPWFYWDWQWDFSLFNSHNISGDSVIPCFRSALHLYGDTLTSVLNSENESTRFKLFPNPVSGGSELKIVLDETEAYQVKITELTGKVLLTETVKGSTSIPVRLQRGIYLVQIASSKKKFLVKKLVVE